MNHHRSDCFETTPKHSLDLNDLSPFIPPSSFHKITFHPLAHPMLESETRSFVVTWQLPGVEYKHVNKSNS